MSRRDGSMKVLRHATLERLMHYYHFVLQHDAGGGNGMVSSARLARLLDMDDTLVRKDLASIGVKGYPRTGFRASEVLEAIRDVLGFNKTYHAIIIGAGRLGGAMASYEGFARYGLVLLACFDSDPLKHGMPLGRTVIQPMEHLEGIVARLGVNLAILTVPAAVAQETADRVVAVGIRAIWNFAPTMIEAPPHVIVRREHIAVGLAELAYHLRSNGHHV